MEVVTGALPSLLPKLADLVAGEYNLQKGLKGEIKFLQEELESMKCALEDISKTPADQIPNGDKIWARNVRELSYDIEDSIDKFLVSKQHGLKKVIDRSLDWLMQPKIRHKIATEIRDIKSRIMEVYERRRRYEVNNLGVDKSVTPTVDPRLFTMHTKVQDLVGIDEATDELIEILEEENEVCMHQGKIVSVVGFGGLGKTTLANAVYEKIRGRFDCSAFVSVSQTPNLKKLFKALLYDLGEDIYEETMDERQLIKAIGEFLEDRRYFIVIDDIWDISVLKIIKCALPENDVGYKIITNTRIFYVAEQAGSIYKLQPLSLNNSRKLMYRRIFGNDNKDINEDIEICPDKELVEVSDRILKKCAGVPLAIITMASLLACKARNKIEWYKVYNSIGSGMENNLDVENMRKILSFSYYELPSHLRTCLLYLSMFPEDYEIDKDRLIWMWIAEGFIQCQKQGKSLFELGEIYFNELINRSMIQPIHNKIAGMLSGCRVHDMVLHLVRNLSCQENFVTVLNDMDHTSRSNTIRRLSLQNNRENLVMSQATRSLQHARSVVVFSSALVVVETLGSFRVLRVLHLHGCDLSQAFGLKYLGNLVHLRYLGLYATNIAQLPKEIGNMQFLQTLELRYNKISSLPSTIMQLRNLMCLYIDKSTRVPNGIGNLVHLQQLLCLRIDDSTKTNMEQLGQLTELRVLHIHLDEWKGKLLESVQKLQNIKDLTINVYPGQRNIGGLDGWVTPRHLRFLDIQESCWFSTLPTSMDPLLLPDLTYLSIAVRELQQVDLEILGRFPVLQFLDLMVDHKQHQISRRLVFGSGSFPCLVQCEFRGFVWPVVFCQGAMTRLRELYFYSLYVREAREITISGSGIDPGLGNLPSLQYVFITLRSAEGACKEAEEVMAVLRRAAEIHPNPPHHWISVDEED